MSIKIEILFFVLLTFLITNGKSFFGFGNKANDNCFCKLEGKIDDCECSVDTVDHFNNVKIYPRMKSLLENEYFRYYRVNLKRNCPYWFDESQCVLKSCSVEPCNDLLIPSGLKGTIKQAIEHPEEAPSYKYTKGVADCKHDHNVELSYLNTTISAESERDFALWKKHDDKQYNFCVEQEENGEAAFVDLFLNPERYTGYKGESAHRIWRSIYEENCFRPRHNIITSYIGNEDLNGMCLEKRAFYRVVSGLHASINVHLCASFLLSEINKNLNFVSEDKQWGPYLDEFIRRFDPATTNGEGPNWLRNLYFVYLLELRALDKAAPYFSYEDFYSGNMTQDYDVKFMVHDLLRIVRHFPHHFDEKTMFNGGLRDLKEDFRQHFRNISKIMDCVGCDKCKLWGKLQTEGLGTALKILFSGKFDRITPQALQHGAITRSRFKLDRNEIVALFNGFGRLSNSIYELEKFREMLKSKSNG